MLKGIRYRPLTEISAFFKADREEEEKKKKKYTLNLERMTRHINAIIPILLKQRLQLKMIDRLFPNFYNKCLPRRDVPKFFKQAKLIERKYERSVSEGLKLLRSLNLSLIV